jgi:hypothetical protein
MRYYLLDRFTGEELESDDESEYGIHFTIPTNTHREYYMVFSAMQDITRDKDLNATDWRVMMYLCEVMDKIGWADRPKTAIAREVGTYRANICASIKKLKEKGYIDEALHPILERKMLRVTANVAGWGHIARDRASYMTNKLKKPCS